MILGALHVASGAEGAGGEGEVSALDFRTVFDEERYLVNSSVLSAREAGLGEDVLEKSAIAIGVDSVIDGWKREYFEGVASDGPLGASPLIFPYTSPNSLAAKCSIVLALKGETMTLPCGPLSFLKAIAHGWRLVDGGITDAVLVGGVTRGMVTTAVVSTDVVSSGGDKHYEGRRVISVTETRGGDGVVIEGMAESFQMVKSALGGNTTVIEAHDEDRNIVRIEFE